MRRPSLSLPSLLCALVLPSLAACGSGRYTPAHAPGHETEDTGVRVRVINHRPTDLTVYLIRNGVRLRLGSVTSRTARTFRVSTSVLGSASSFRLAARPRAERNSRPIFSRRAQVFRGRVTEWSVEQSAHLSTLVVR